jgi:hypothetical protein
MLDGTEIGCAYNLFNGYGYLERDFEGGWSFVDKFTETALSDDWMEYINTLKQKADELGVDLKIPSGNPKCRKCGGLHLCRADTGRCISCMVVDKGKRMVADMSPRQRAIIEGKQWYIPTTPCKTCGELAERNVATGRCSSCMVANKGKRRVVNMSPRKKAIIEGQRWYIPTTPCKTCGELAERKVATGACSNCINRDEDGRATPESELMRTEPNAIISKEQAKMLGLKVYRTGRPCNKGHTGWRYVSTNSCIDCLRGR